MSEKSPRYWLCYLSTIWLKCQADLKVSVTFYSWCWLISTISRKLSPFFSKFIRKLTFQTFCSKFSSKLKVHPKIPNSPMLICVRVYVCVCVCSSSCYCCFCHWFVCDFSRKWFFLRISSGQSQLTKSTHKVYRDERLSILLTFQHENFWHVCRERSCCCCCCCCPRGASNSARDAR